MQVGAKRLVVGAHYGLRGWMVQRATAVVLIVYLAVLAAQIGAAWPLDYDPWAGIFVPLGMKIATLIAFVALAYHAWVGMRDIWMDYVRHTGARVVLQLLTILWLAVCLIWSVQILWTV